MNTNHQHMFAVTLWLLATTLVGTEVFAQSDQQLARYFKQNPAADSNGDGKLSREEARSHRQAHRQPRAEDPSEGDNLKSRSHIPGVDIPVSVSPVIEVTLQSGDGVDLSFAYRKPAGKGPFPTILFFHGGGGQSNLQGLRNNLLTGAIQTRFLESGYLTIASTRRPYWKSKDKRPTGFYDAVEDAAKIVEKTKTIPAVNPNQVVLYGGSGGAILAIATASKTDLACVVAGEPATVVALDPKTGEEASPADYRKLMENPAAKLTPDRRAEIRAWMKEINCPVLVLQGKHIGLYKTNFEILIPEMKRLNKDISSISYPGVTHGFYWGTVKTGATLETVEQIMKDTTAYIEISFRRN
jgi:dipeptidyl aminopeptidase/acylaminoacyl peptidase